MNGEVNGSMAEPMETCPSSPVDHKKLSNDCNDELNNCEDINTTDISSHIENESDLVTENVPNKAPEVEPNQVTAADSNDENSINDNSKDSGDHQSTECITETTINISTQDNNDTENNHCSNSNESFQESISSSHAKSETNEPQDVQSMDEKSKDGDSETNYNRIDNANGGHTEELDSDEDSSEEEGSVISDNPKVEDTVSINSESDPDCGDDTSQESQTKLESNDIIILENDNRPDSQNGNSCDALSPEIHEIVSDNDDCILTNDEKSNSSNSENKIHLRRSGRAIKRKRYDGDDDLNGNDESDIEEVEMVDPLGRSSKPIVINDTKALVEMAAKHIKSNQSKEPTVVIIDTKSGKRLPSHSKNAVTSINSTTTAQSLYQSIVARGTTVTPVSSKTTSTQMSPQNVQPIILPSLTDDMFVVEAPSFIVPYVYEKPSIKPFREFVDVLGKELDAKRAKEEQEQLEKEKEEKEKRDKEKKEKRDRGEPVEESEEEADTITKTNDTEDEERRKKRIEKQERKQRKNMDDDASWDGESSTDSEETLSDIEKKTVVLKDKADSIEEIKDVTDLTGSKASSGKSDNYFDCSLGKYFINIGLNLVQEFVQNDLLKQQNRKLYREKKSGHSTKATESSISSLKKNLEFSKENNMPYTFPQKKCEFCSFKTESMLAMSHHLETPHMKNNVYKCNYCAFEIRSPHDILYHMEAEHNVRGKLERAPAYHQCPNCTFEDNGKGKLARHQIACAKKFKPDHNLAPSIEWEPPAKIPKMTRARSNMVSSYQSVFNRQVANNMGRAVPISNFMPSSTGMYRARGRVPMAGQSRAAPVHGAPIIRGGVMVRHNAPAAGLISNYPIANNGKAKTQHQPSISITPLPRQPQPVLPQPVQSKSTFVICEICDGYIKDLEQLRNHMQWIHKVKIHPKMIYNRPPLNCQKCQFRFFTDQGLERHLLGSHGLVTSSMQEAANKGKDAGRCPVCGRVYQWKLLNHVARDHNLTLKPAHLSYKCTVCSATFGMYKQFENHVYSSHSVVAKRVIDKSKTIAPPAKSTPNDSLLKPLKINDEITIIPQPVKPATSAKNK